MLFMIRLRVEFKGSFAVIYNASDVAQSVKDLNEAHGKL